MTVEKCCPLQSDVDGTVACQLDDCEWYMTDSECCVAQSILQVLEFISESVCDAIEKNDVKNKTEQ